MALRTIVATPDDVLRRKARPITTFDKNLQTLIDDMVETMREAPGVGLAAPQVGISQRLIVIEYGEEEDEENVEEGKEIPKKLYAVINPEIIKKSEETVMGVEGCLSVPGLQGEVDRHESVVVKGKNRRGQPMRIKAEGWLARIFQHEIDHLDGILYTDRATRVWQPAPDEPLQDNV
jgi:peptide deformylase